MREMNARFAGRCAGGCGVRVQQGDAILWSKETGAIHVGCRDAYWGNEFGRHEAAQERAAYEAEMRQEDAELRAGAAAVREIQALTTAGSALREALYLEMEQRDYDLYG